MDHQQGNVNKFEEWIGKNSEEDSKNALILLTSEESPRKFTKFVVNRFTLEGASPEFKKLLEAGPTRGYAYEIEDVSEKDFQAVIEHIFKLGPWDFKNLAETLDLLEVVQKFNLIELRKDIYAKLGQLINDGEEIFDNHTIFQAFSLFRTSDFKDEFLTKVALQYILKNAADLLQRDEFLELTCAEVKEIVAEDDLAVYSELDVYQALIRWSLHDITREGKEISTEPITHQMASLFPFVRFRNLSKLEIERCVLPNNIPLVKETGEIVMDFFKSQKRKGEDEDNKDFPCNPRKYLKMSTGNELISLFMKQQTSLDITKAEQFASTLKLELQNFNEHIEKKKLLAETESQAETVRDLKSTILQLRTKLLKVEDLSARLRDRHVHQILLASEFKETKEFAISILIENHASSALKFQEKYFKNSDTLEYFKIGDDILVGGIEKIGFTGPQLIAGFVSYRIENLLFIVKYCVNASSTDLVLAFCPPSFAAGKNLFEKIRDGEWSGNDGRILEDAWVRLEMIRTKDFEKDKELKLAVTLGNFHASATMKTGNKALASIVISEC